MRSRAGRDQLVRLRALAIDDIMTIRQLADAGVSSSLAYRRCGPGGPWQLLLPGVLLLHSGPPTWRQRLRAALVYGGDDAMLTGAAAAQLHGIRRADPQGMVHLLLPHRTRRRSAGHVRVERTHRLPDAVDLHGFRCAPVTRSVLDHARLLRTATEVQALIAEAAQRRFCTPLALQDELDAGSRRGTGLVRRELQDVLGGARSVSEITAKRLVAGSRLPEPEWNVALYTADGLFVGNPDAWFADVGLAWEIDSREYHQDPVNYARTLRRNARYAGHGVPMLPTLPSRITTEPKVVLQELVDAYEAAARGPRPQVVVVREVTAA